MKKIKQNKKAFTLIEVIVAITIFSVILISIMTVYFTANDITYKSDINRTMHENMKNVVLNISEDVMKNGIIGVAKDTNSCSSVIPSGDTSLFGNKFCSSNDYYLAKKEGEIFIITDDTFCSDFQKNHCYIVKNGEPLTNDLVTISDLGFYITNEKIKKVTMSITLKPAPKSGVKPSLVEKTKLVNQITLSERQYK